MGFMRKLTGKSNLPDAVLFKDRNGNVIFQVDTTTGTVTIGGNIVITGTTASTGNISTAGNVAATGGITASGDVTVTGSSNAVKAPTIEAGATKLVSGEVTTNGATQVVPFTAKTNLGQDVAVTLNFVGGIFSGATLDVDT